MVLSHHFWNRYFREEFVPQLRGIVDVLERRTLPAFAGIVEEAQAVSEKLWGAFMSAPGTGEEDPGDFAEAAEDAGVSYYMLLDGIRQGMVNLFTAALYHAFEQQVMFFLRKQILHPRDENDPTLFQMSEFRKRLKAMEIDVTQLPSWPKVEELKLAANTVKHAEGDSAQRLHQIRPDLFEPPGLNGISPSFTMDSAHVFQPLIGEGLYVSLTDVQEYRDSLVSFWMELSNAIERA